jgi:hypothetical protein
VVRKTALQQAPVVEQFDREKMIPSLERGQCWLGIQFLGLVPESEANFWVFVGGARVPFPADHVGWVALAPGKYGVCYIRSGAIKMAVATLIPGEALLIGFRFYGSISFSKWDGSRALDPQDFAVTNRRSLENQ